MGLLLQYPPWEPSNVADTPLAQLLAEKLQGQFRSKSEAARTIGVDLVTLSSILSERRTRIKAQAAQPLSQYLGCSISALKRMVKQGKTPVVSPNAGRIQELEDEIARLKAEVESGAIV